MFPAMVFQDIKIGIGITIAGLFPLIPNACLAQDSEENIAYFSQRYCIDPDGDHRVTWLRAERDGFSELLESTFSGLRVLGPYVKTLRGFEKSLHGKNYRILTAAYWWRAPEQGETYSRYCWVSSSDDNVDDVDKDMKSITNVSHFRVDKVRIFAWIPRPGGSLEAVSRRDYMREGLTLAREQGMRQITLRQSEDAVFIGYVSPRDENTFQGIDRTGPDPVPVE